MAGVLVAMVGASAALASLGLILIATVYVVLSIGMYRVGPLLAAGVGVSVLADLCADAIGLPFQGLAGDVVGALLLTHAAGAIAARRSGCPLTQGLFAATSSAAAWAVGRRHEAVVVGLGMYAIGAGTLAVMHFLTPWVVTKLPPPKGE